MNRWRKAGVAAVVGIAVVGFGGAALAAWAGARIDRRWSVPAEAVEPSEDAEVVARGERLAGMMCANCHGIDLGGAVVFDDPTLAVIDAPNLTPGTGSATLGATAEEWVRAIRHGVGRDGRGLLVMPSADFQHLTADDLGALVAYLRRLPAVDRPTRPVHTTALGRALMAVGAFGDLLDVETLDHGAELPSGAARPGSAEHGAYLVATLGCRTCHGERLTGGKDPDPAAPRGPDLSRSGPTAEWTEETFVTAMRTGRTPQGQLSDFMPWRTLGRADDVELHAIWTYLRAQ